MEGLCGVFISLCTHPTVMNATMSGSKRTKYGTKKSEHLSISGYSVIPSSLEDEDSYELSWGLLSSSRLYWAFKPFASRFMSCMVRFLSENLTITRNINIAILGRYSSSLSRSRSDFL